MKNFLNKPLVTALTTALLLAGSCVAQAAHLEYVDHLVLGGYSGSSNGAAFSEDLLDLSAAGDVTLFGANTFAGASLNHGYAADTFYSNGSVALSFSQYVSTVASTATTVASHQQDVLSSLTSMTLKIAGDGEANGSAVQVNFAGLADAFSTVVSGVSGYTQMDIAVISGGNVLGSFLWDASDLTAQQDFGFGFAALVGDEFTLSATLGSGVLFNNLEIAPHATAYELASVGGMLNGNFTVTSVPEPEGYAMLLAGLGLMGVVLKRRQ